MNERATALVVLQTMFFGRVIGQVVATLAEPSWLPAPVHWFSGALPYPVLLPLQILLLMFMTVVTNDALRETGYWHVQRPRTKRILRYVAWSYVAVNCLRYLLTMAFVPDLRWTGHAIPIAFHFVLAGYILVLSFDEAPDVLPRSVKGNADKALTDYR